MSVYDGPPDFFITNNRLSRPKPKASLAALQWAAERANLSYGVFTLNLTEADQSRIQAEYDLFLSVWKEEMTARQQSRVVKELSYPRRVHHNR